MTPKNLAREKARRKGYDQNPTPDTWLYEQERKRTRRRSSQGG